MFPVLDRNPQRMSLGLKISNNGRHCPVAIPVDDIAAIAVLEEIWVEPVVVGPRTRMRSNARFPGRVSHFVFTQGGMRGFRSAAVQRVIPLAMSLRGFQECRPPLGHSANSQSATVPFPPVTPLEAAVALIPMLLPSWMDPEELIKSFGPYALWGVAFIVFAECGLFAILPGDSLLFTVGLLTAAGVDPLQLGVRLHRAHDRCRAGQCERLCDRTQNRAAALQTA